MFYFWKARGEAVDLRFYIAVASIKHVFSCEYVQLLLEKVLNSPAISFQAKWPIQRHEPFHLYNVCACVLRLHSQALVWKLGTLLWQLKASIASCVINAFFQRIRNIVYIYISLWACHYSHLCASTCPRSRVQASVVYLYQNCGLRPRRQGGHQGCGKWVFNLYPGDASWVQGKV